MVFHLFRTDDHLSHDLCHQRLGMVGSLLHLLMADLHGIIKAAKVGDDRHTEGADATMVSHDDLRNGGHAHGIAAHQTVHLIFCRRLKGGTLHSDIDAVLHFDALLLGNLVGQCHQREIVGLVHIGEARPCGEVLTAERMLWEEVDVIGDDHQVTDAEGGVHTASGITDEERLDAQLIHHSDREGHLLHRVALVEVETALHGQNVDATELAEDQFAAMALDGGYREVGDIGVGKLRLVRYF